MSFHYPSLLNRVGLVPYPWLVKCCLSKTQVDLTARRDTSISPMNGLRPVPELSRKRIQIKGFHSLASTGHNRVGAQRATSMIWITVMGKKVACIKVEGRKHDGKKTHLLV